MDSIHEALPIEAQLAIFTVWSAIATGAYFRLQKRTRLAIGLLQSVGAENGAVDTTQRTAAPTFSHSSHERAGSVDGNGHGRARIVNVRSESRTETSGSSAHASAFDRQSRDEERECTRSISTVKCALAGCRAFGESLG
jgi:hypothetical protein